LCLVQETNKTWAIMKISMSENNCFMILILEYE